MRGELSGTEGAPSPLPQAPGRPRPAPTQQRPQLAPSRARHHGGAQPLPAKPTRPLRAAIGCPPRRSLRLLAGRRRGPAHPPARHLGSGGGRRPPCWGGRGGVRWRVPWGPVWDWHCCHPYLWLPRVQSRGWQLTVCETKAAHCVWNTNIAWGRWKFTLGSHLLAAGVQCPVMESAPGMLLGQHWSHEGLTPQSSPEIPSWQCWGCGPVLAVPAPALQPLLPPATAQEVAQCLSLSRFLSGRSSPNV